MQNEGESTSPAIVFFPHPPTRQGRDDPGHGTIMPYMLHDGQADKIPPSPPPDVNVAKNQDGRERTPGDAWQRKTSTHVIG